MQNLNRIIICGRLTKDPDLKQTSAGTTVLEFSLAYNTSRKNGQGEYEDVANYIDCTVFGARADILSRYLHKGNKVTVEGRLVHSRWETKDGDKRSKHSISVDHVELPEREKQSAPVQESSDFLDEDIPF